MKYRIFFWMVLIIAFSVGWTTTSFAGPGSKSKSNKTKKEISSKKLSKSAKKGSLIFISHCAACHKAGKNQAKPSRPVIGSSTLATFATFKAYLNKPVGNMPHYDHLINDEQLLKNLYDYTKSLDASSNKINLKESKVGVRKDKKE